MNPFQSILILVAAFLAVFAETALSAPRHLLGAQIDLLPAIMVYAALNTGLPTISLLAIFGGLSFDSLSANPLGISILPLFIVGWTVMTLAMMLPEGDFCGCGPCISGYPAHLAARTQAPAKPWGWLEKCA